MSARMERTNVPGIFKRGSRYVVTYRVAGKQKRETARTMTEARRLKAARTADVARGEFFEASRLTFKEYASEWIERYQGRGKGFRFSTRKGYRSALERFGYPFLGHKRLAELTPRDVSNFIGWLCDEKAQSDHAYALAVEAAKREGTSPPPRRHTTKHLSDSTVRNIINPVRACLATAVTEGLIRHSPARGVSLPHRPNVDRLDADEVRPFTRKQLADFLRVCPDRHKPMFRLMAAAGLRVSEVLGLQWRHLHLGGSAPHVKVRRAYVRGRFEPPKSRHGRRDVPLGPALVDALRRHRKDTEWPGDDDLVFPSLTGSPLSDTNLRRRTLRPIVEEIGADWASFHTFRHTCASLLFERGANAKQVQRWLGHHSAAFTLDTYIHLLDDGVGDALDLDSELAHTDRRLLEIQVAALG